MSTHPGKGSLGRQGASVWSLLVPLWVYAALIGLLAAGAGHLLASNPAWQWTVTTTVVLVGGGSFPAVFGVLRRVSRNRH